MAAKGGGAGSAAAVKAGEAFVEISGRDEKLKKSLDGAKSKLNQFAESSKKVLGQLGARTGAAEAVGGLGGLAGVAGMGAAGVATLGGVGAIEFGKWITGFKQFEADFSRTTDQVAKTAARLREVIVASTTKALDERDLGTLKRNLRTANQDYQNTLNAFNAATERVAQAQRGQTAGGRLFAGFIGLPTEVEQAEKTLKAYETALRESGQTLEATRAAMERFKATQKATTDTVREAIKVEKEREQKTIEGVVGAALEQIETHGMTDLEKKIRELRKPFPLPRLQSMQPDERNRVEDELNRAEKVLREADRISKLPKPGFHPIAGAIIRAIGGAPGVPKVADFGSSRGAFQSAGFRQLFGGGGVDAKQLAALGKANDFLSSIDRGIDRLKGVFT